MIIPERRMEEQRSPEVSTEPQLRKLLVEGEVLLGLYKDINLVFGFTNRRAILMLEGTSHMDCDMTSLPFSRLVSFSIRGENYWNTPVKIDMIFAHIGRVKFKVKSPLDIVSFAKLLSSYIL